MRLQTIAILAASLLAGGALTGAVAQAAGMADVIKARHGNFEKMGKAMKAIMGELKRPNPSLAVIRPNAKVLNTRAQLVANGFPKGSGPESGLKTEALATIWQKPAEFDKSRSQLVTATGALVQAAAGGDIARIKAAQANVGAACKGCHDQFRQKD